MQFLDDLVAPVAAEALLCQVPPACGEPNKNQGNRQAKEDEGEPDPGRVTYPPAMEPRPGRFGQQGRRHVDSYGQDE